MSEPTPADRTATEWRIFTCSGDGEDECGYAIIHRVPQGSHRERACDVDFCPACGSHLSLLGYGGSLTITNEFGRTL
jgi:hypothetical protein